MGRGNLVDAARLELVSGVVQLRPEDAMAEAMLHGWRAQQKARGLQDATIEPRERLVRAFIEFTNEYPWNWGAGPRRGVDAVAFGGATPGALDDPGLPDGPAAVQRVRLRRPVRVGGGMREGVRAREVPSAGLP